MPNQASSEDVSGEAGPKPGPTRQIVRTSQAKPGPNQGKPGRNQANCEDLPGETGPKPGETRGETRQIVRMSQAGRAAQPGQTRGNQGRNQANFEDVLGRTAQTRLHPLSLIKF